MFERIIVVARIPNIPEEVDRLTASHVARETKLIDKKAGSVVTVKLSDATPMLSDSRACRVFTSAGPSLRDL